MVLLSIILNFFKDNTMPIKKIHIVNAHQKWDGIAEGKLTGHYIELMGKIFDKNEVTYTTTNIDDGYNIEMEISSLVTADLVILQFPMYWMGLPWLGKKYIDEVFMAGQGKIYENDGREINEPNKKYGSGGLLNGKYMLSITCNAPAEAFSEAGQLFNGLGTDNAFIAIHNALIFVGLTPLPSFISYDVFKNPNIESDGLKLEQLLLDALHA